jgi:RNA polymerase sigma-70 factor (ECF subfamily)
MLLEESRVHPAQAGEDKSDEEIVRLTLLDQEYFLHIIKRYKDKLFRYVMRISNLDEEGVEDVLQDVFLKVYQNLNDFDDSLKFSSWIYRITHNQVISNFRKLKARPQKAGFDLDDDLVKNLASELDLIKEFDAKLLEQQIASVLERLDTKYKEVLVLKFLEEKSYNEISDIIRKPVGTVGSLINRAKKDFGKEYEKEKKKIALK